MSSTENTQDSNKDNTSAPAQQQVQVPPQAQTPSQPDHQQPLPAKPPSTADQQTLPVTPAESEHTTVALPLTSKRQHHKLVNYIPIYIAAIALTVLGVIVSLLNITGTIKGPWSSIFGVVCAAAGVITGVLQLYFQFVATPTASITTMSLPSDPPSPKSLDESFSIPRPNKNKGVLLVLTKRMCRGLCVDLSRGYGEDKNIYAAQNIVEWKIGRRTYYVAVFRSLPPGPYTAQIENCKMLTRVWIDAGQVTKIDWR